jgi:hypothetical protein
MVTTTNTGNYGSTNIRADCTRKGNTQHETFIPKPATFQPFGLRSALRYSYKCRGQLSIAECLMERSRRDAVRRD